MQASKLIDEYSNLLLSWARAGMIHELLTFPISYTDSLQGGITTLRVWFSMLAAVSRVGSPPST